VSYVAAVEAADGQELEFGVARAINDFVTGCKQDNIWDAIKACCILAGARTLDGALVPLVKQPADSAPARFGTEGGWNYNRKTGLQGNGTDNYINSGRNNNADPQDNNHNAVYAKTLDAPSQLMAAGMIGNNITTGGTRNRSSTFTPASPQAGFIGTSRSIPASYLYRDNNTTTSISVNSVAPDTTKLYVFARNQGGVGDSYSASRLAFYSIGESLDLALLDTRVSNLMTAIGAAIP
jgi:hypothetical protein